MSKFEVGDEVLVRGKPATIYATPAPQNGTHLYAARIHGAVGEFFFHEHEIARASIKLPLPLAQSLLRLLEQQALFDKGVEKLYFELKGLVP